MTPIRTLFQSSFRFKILMPVVGVMITVLVLTAAMVNLRITRQFDMEASRSLSRADVGFRDWQDHRARNLLLRFEVLRTEPRFKAAFQTGDAPTVRAQMNDLLSTSDPEVRIVLYADRGGETLGSAARDRGIAAGAFALASATVVRNALRGEEGVDTIKVGERVYNAVSIPAYTVAGDICGALTFGIELDLGAARELSQFTRSDIVLLANGRVLATTLPGSDSNGRWAKLFQELSQNSGQRRAALHVQKEIFNNRHYYCSAGRLPSLRGDASLGYLLLDSYEDAWRSLMTTQQILLEVNGLACLIGTLVLCYLVGKLTQPLRELRDNAEAVGRGDFSRRVAVQGQDELGELAQVFNRMTENLRASRAQLEEAQAELLEASRRAGMAEVATGVLHNVGNVLTSVNVASSLIAEGFRKSKAAYLPKLAAMLREHADDLTAFLTQDPKGKQIPQYLGELSGHLMREQEATLQELAHLQAGIEHIREIVKAQQSYSKKSSAPEQVKVEELVEDALRMNPEGRASIQIAKELTPGLVVTLEKHKALQILVNLIRNAKQACAAAPLNAGRLQIRATRDDRRVCIAITDNGMGIAPENLSHIFNHGFTTKKDGHGFGLHSSSVAAAEMGGALRAQSDGPGKGATFTLELPATPPASSTAPAANEKPAA